MDRNMRQRLVMAGIGGLAGISLYLLMEMLGHHVLSDRAGLALTTFAAVFFGGWLALAGPLRLVQGVTGAAAVGAMVAGLLTLATLRFETVEGVFDHPAVALAVLVLAMVPLPFLIAAAGPGWRDYPTLFTEAWNVVVRYAAAWLFVGVVWSVLFLSDSLLSIVGIEIIEQIIETDPAPWIITGVTLGLALAVVTELSYLVSPYLILRLLRLLLPLVLVVMAVFIVALPLQGLWGLRFGGLSVAVTLLAMAGAAAMLVTTAIDQNDAEAVQGRLMTRATQALALLLPIPAALAGYAVWVRTTQYGWTPDRLFAALVAIMALAYGLIYALSVMRGRGWMARIRQGNVTMALALLAVAALWLTPVLNAERISARDQLARFDAGHTPLDRLDLYAIGRWGKPGQAVLDELQIRSAQPGQEALARKLAGTSPSGEPGLTDAEAREALAALMPVQPPQATAMRDRILDGTDAGNWRYWLGQCQHRTADGRPGCVLVVADLWPATPGDEALLVLRGEGAPDYQGFVFVDGTLRFASTQSIGAFPEGGDEVIARLQDGPPDLSPAPLKQIAIGKGHVIVMP